MALTIYGRFNSQDKQFIEDLTIRETWTAITTIEDGHENDEAYFEQGDDALVAAEEFLHVLDRERSTLR